jgi:hypothetical protein
MASPDLLFAQCNESLLDPATAIPAAKGQTRLDCDGTGAAPQCIGRQECEQRFLRARERVRYDRNVVVVSTLPECIGKSSEQFPEWEVLWHLTPKLSRAVKRLRID